MINNSIDPKTLESAILFGNFLRIVANPNELQTLVDQFTKQVQELQTLLGNKAKVEDIDNYNLSVHRELERQAQALENEKMEFEKLRDQFHATQKAIEIEASEHLVRAKTTFDQAMSSLKNAQSQQEILEAREQDLNKRESNLNQLNASLAEMKADLEAKARKIRELAS